MSVCVADVIRARIFQKIRIYVLLALFALISLTSAAFAQTQPPLEGPPPRWWTALGIQGREYFDTPEEACQRQHQYYNPGAPYQSPVYVSYLYYGCRWDMTAPTASTILPSVANLSCEEYPGYGLSNDGRCISFYARDGDCVCEEGTRPPTEPVQPVIGNPVALSYGAKIERIDDYASADGLFTVTRHYRSRPRNVRTLKSTREIAGFGKHWHGLVPGRLTVVGVRSELMEYM